MNNLFLTGLCGCGKTSLGREAAARMGRPFLDTDQWVEEKAGASISEIFARDGEAAFREWEALAIRQAARLDGAVVATGGGAILDRENVRVMRESGRILFIDRPPESILMDLATENRPLAREEGAFQRLVEERMPLYRERCDLVLVNDGHFGKACADLEALMGRLP